jgi:hypothetical protein
VTVFGFIAAKKAEHSIKIMCRLLEVSRSGFHAWAQREPSPRADTDAALTGRIAEIHKDSLKTYGSPRVHAELRLEDGVHVGRKRVERLMRRAGLSGQIQLPRPMGQPRPGRPVRRDQVHKGARSPARDGRRPPDQDTGGPRGARAPSASLTDFNLRAPGSQVSRRLQVPARCSRHHTR